MERNYEKMQYYFSVRFLYYLYLPEKISIYDSFCDETYRYLRLEVY